MKQRRAELLGRVREREQIMKVGARMSRWTTPVCQNHRSFGNIRSPTEGNLQVMTVKMWPTPLGPPAPPNQPSCATFQLVVETQIQTRHVGDTESHREARRLPAHSEGVKVGVFPSLKIPMTSQTEIRKDPQAAEPSPRPGSNPAEVT